MIQAFLLNALFVRSRRPSALKLIYEHIHIETSVGLNTFTLDVGYMKHVRSRRLNILRYIKL